MVRQCSTDGRLSGRVSRRGHTGALSSCPIFIPGRFRAPILDGVLSIAHIGSGACAHQTAWKWSTLPYAASVLYLGPSTAIVTWLYT